MQSLLYRDKTYAIRSAVYEVYRELGCGFLEAVYQESLELEFSKQNIPFKAQAELELFYKGQKLKKLYRPDLICYDCIIVELKGISFKTWGVAHFRRIIW